MKATPLSGLLTAIPCGDGQHIKFKHHSLGSGRRSLPMTAPLMQHGPSQSSHTLSEEKHEPARRRYQLQPRARDIVRVLYYINISLVTIMPLNLWTTSPRTRSEASYTAGRTQKILRVVFVAATSIFVLTHLFSQAFFWFDDVSVSAVRDSADLLIVTTDTRALSIPEDPLTPLSVRTVAAL